MKKLKKVTKVNYDIRVHVVNDGNSYRLRFWNRHTKKHIKHLEKRFQAKSLSEAIRIRDAEQASERWVNYVERLNSDSNFIEFFEDLVAGKRNDNTRSFYLRSILKLKEYCGSEIPFTMVNKNFIEGFKQFLLRDTEKQNTASGYFSCFAHAIRSAEEKGHIKHLFFKRIPQAQVLKDFLTKPEISQIIRTPWQNRLKQAFILECLTAIAYQELKNLQWKDINRDELVVTVKRKKTGVIISNPINREILMMLGEPGDRTALVFPELTSQNTYNNNIKRLVAKAGIKKHITSHSGRASCLINIISGKGGLYSAKNFAGHTDLKTTLRYAQFSAEMKRDAGNDLMKGIDFSTNN